ncbi:MAG: ribulose bisphosphate carboxylase small subunit [Hydrogenovibrio sp.]|jgi:ribulose-bisphosphate carboxylase small chain|uniref:ribulose bisphosphate carboxylase small subunit n=1 Tax=Hydrogenovibrio TaxID=28884 RepID=UPI0003689E52|nr:MULTISPECIES: ribulose bisphosphate carboxylase small subunit [Hydrogenovibrio]MDR9498145.1 ribulose bisphosphate carboxylase small subunit [Hydrogenovibrio sp.]
MSEVQDYPSRLSDPKSRKAETFSYLPKMNEEQLRKQVQYIIDQGWNPAIEHTEPEHAFQYFWYMWKLPMFGETSVDRVMEELDACIKANPNNHVRLIGYNNYTQSQGANMLIKRGDM